MGEQNDIARLAALYFASYDPFVACSTLEAALVDIRALFAYDYGILRPKAPPVVVCDGETVAALITVHRAAWSDTPDYPFYHRTLHRSHASTMWIGPRTPCCPLRRRT